MLLVFTGKSRMFRIYPQNTDKLKSHVKCVMTLLDDSKSLKDLFYFIVISAYK